jgi:hypothetical protein
MSAAKTRRTLGAVVVDLLRPPADPVARDPVVEVQGLESGATGGGGAAPGVTGGLDAGLASAISASLG